MFLTIVLTISAVSWLVYFFAWFANGARALKETTGLLLNLGFIFQVTALVGLAAWGMVKAA